MKEKEKKKICDGRGRERGVMEEGKRITVKDRKRRARGRGRRRRGGNGMEEGKRRSINKRDVMEEGKNSRKSVTWSAVPHALLLVS